MRTISRIRAALLVVAMPQGSFAQQAGSTTPPAMDIPIEITAPVPPGSSTAPGTPPAPPVLPVVEPWLRGFLPRTYAISRSNAREVSDQTFVEQRWNRLLGASMATAYGGGFGLAFFAFVTAGFSCTVGGPCAPNWGLPLIPVVGPAIFLAVHANDADRSSIAFSIGSLILQVGSITGLVLWRVFPERRIVSYPRLTHPAPGVRQHPLWIPWFQQQAQQTTVGISMVLP